MNIENKWINIAQFFYYKSILFKNKLVDQALI